MPNIENRVRELESQQKQTGKLLKGFNQRIVRLERHAEGGATRDEVDELFDLAKSIKEKVDSIAAKVA